jgi:outer membrane receptor for ferrienterochelin and colicins
MLALIRITVLLFVLGNYHSTQAQNLFYAFIKSETTKEPLLGASAYFETLKMGTAANNQGLTLLKGIPNGEYILKLSCIGYETKIITISFPVINASDTTVYFLKPEALQTAGQVVISSTRNNGVETNTPMRIEVLGQEEVNEEIAIRPGNISKLLGETSGILVQQTSPISGNVSFRLEGLPGAYTQLLKDGFSNYSGFSSGLSLLQIPPLDLRQVEVIKGSLSTLYGDGAIAGMVNLISREPTAKPEWQMLLNATNKKGDDFSSFYSGRVNKLGVTFLTSLSLQNAFDVNGDGFTDIPFYRQITLSPRLFYDFSDSTSLVLGVSTFFENRKGGDIYAIENGVDSLHQYFERNGSRRINTQLRFNSKFRNKGELTFKNSINYFNRNIDIKNVYFSGKQLSSCSELSYLVKIMQHRLVIGMNILSDSFRRRTRTQMSFPNYDHYTLGAFFQDDWNAPSSLIIQPALRFDYHNKYGIFAMPHFSTLYKFRDNTSIRLSAGLGYRIPSLINLISENDIAKNNVSLAPGIKTEISRSINLDFSHKILFKPFMVTINQAFFITHVNNAIIPDYFRSSDSLLVLNNANSSLSARGSDTNINLGYDELNLFLDYSFTEVKKKLGSAITPLALTPRSKLNLTLTFEGEGNWRTGIEAFYTGRQYLVDNTRSRGFWIFGAMLEKIFRRFSIIGNIENVFDERQTRHERIILPPTSDPTFKPIFEPLDGMVANVALEIKLR